MNATKPDYNKWYALRLNEQLDNGYFLFPVGGYTKDDNPKFPDEPKRIDIAGLNYHVLDEFVKPNASNEFTIEPWETISITQKIALEDELSKELGFTSVNRSIFKFLFPKEQEVSIIILSYSALCKDSRSDNVLFAINRTDIKEAFVVIHLTWTGIQELNGYPKKKYYKAFDDFKIQRMFPDNRYCK